MNFNKQNEELETALKNGTAYILPPKYFLIPSFLHVIFWFGIWAIIVYMGFKFNNYADKLAEDCKTIFELNSVFIKDLSAYLCVLLFIFLPMLTFDIISIRNSKQPPSKATPYLFSERVVYLNKTNNQSIDIGKYIFCILIIILTPSTNSNLPNVTNDLIYLNIAQANENYQQRCLAKEFPFERLRKDKP